MSQGVKSEVRHVPPESELVARTVHRRELSKSAICMVGAFIDSLGITFSGNHNALYRKEHFIAVLLHMCKASMTAAAAAEDMDLTLGLPRVPTSQWFLGKIAVLNPHTVENACWGMLFKTVRIAIDSGLMPIHRILVAIDYHKIPFTGKTRDENVVPGKPKGGTSRFEGYMTAHHVGLPGLLALAVQRITAGMEKADCVVTMLSAIDKLGITVRILLMDSEFCTVAVMTAVHARKQWFLVAAPQNSGISKAIDKRIRNKLDKVSWYIMESTDGNGFMFNLVIFKKLIVVDKKRTWKYVTLATNMPRRVLIKELDGLLEVYGQRWTIENNYKSVESCRAKTCSRNHAKRTFLFYMSLIECNLWYLTNLELKASVKGGVRARRRKAASLHVKLKAFIGGMEGILLKLLHEGSAFEHNRQKCVKWKCH